MNFDWIELDGVECGAGHVYTYPPAIEQGHSFTSVCAGGHDEDGPQIDDYRLFCPVDEFYVSETFAECPNDRSHHLVPRED